MRSDPALFTEPEEWSLWLALRRVRAEQDRCIAAGDYVGAIRCLRWLIRSDDDA